MNIKKSNNQGKGILKYVVAIEDSKGDRQVKQEQQKIQKPTYQLSPILQVQPIQPRQTSRYKKLKRLGEGSYGSVSMCYDSYLDKNIALKKIKFNSSDQGIPVTTLRQISALKHLKHENIIAIHDVHYLWFEKKIFLNLEYCLQNLGQHIKRNDPLPPNIIKVHIKNTKSYLYQIVSAIKYMNENSMMHRDLKPQNILINDKGKLKLCDFGETKKFGMLQSIRITTGIGTLWYKAPEMLLGSTKCTTGVDVWSIGVIFAEMAIGQPLFQGDSQIGQIFKIFKVCGTPSWQEQGFKDCRHLSPSFPKFTKMKMQMPNIGETGNNLLQKMLQLNPWKRIGIGKILKHDYFQGIQ